LKTAISDDSSAMTVRPMLTGFGRFSAEFVCAEQAILRWKQHQGIRFCHHTVVTTDVN
jgi:hypothetical protein